MSDSRLQLLDDTSKLILAAHGGKKLVDILPIVSKYYDHFENTVRNVYELVGWADLNNSCIDDEASLFTLAEFIQHGPANYGLEDDIAEFNRMVQIVINVVNARYGTSWSFNDLHIDDDTAADFVMFHEFINNASKQIVTLFGNQSIIDTDHLCIGSRQTLTGSVPFAKLEAFAANMTAMINRLPNALLVDIKFNTYPDGGAWGAKIGTVMHPEVVTIMSRLRSAPDQAYVVETIMDVLINDTTFDGRVLTKDDITWRI